MPRATRGSGEGRGSSGRMGTEHSRPLAHGWPALGLPPPVAMMPRLASGPGTLAVARPPVVETLRSRPSVETVTVPSTSVRRTRAPVSFSRSTVSGAGWPYGLSRPALTTATRGAMEARNVAVLAVRLPW